MNKYLNGFINTNLSTCIQPSHKVKLRGSCKKQFKMPYRLNITCDFFAYPTVNVWNLLDNDVVKSRNCNTFNHVLENISLSCGRALLDCRN